MKTALELKIIADNVDKTNIDGALEVIYKNIEVFAVHGFYSCSLSLKDLTNLNLDLSERVFYFKKIQSTLSPLGYICELIIPDTITLRWR